MDWLQTLDANWFDFVHVKLQCAALDGVMGFLSRNLLFVPFLLALVIWLLAKGGTRGRVFILVLAVVLPLGDAFVINVLKHSIARERPLPGLFEGSAMPSAHAASWFAASLLAFVYYRRSWRFTLPVAALVSFSRIYVGANYPGDVLVGAIVGGGYAVAGLFGLNALWRWAGRKWFPLWRQRMPSLTNPDARIESGPVPPQVPASVTIDQHWMRLGCVVIAVMFLGRLAYLAGDTIELSKDEAYQWVWSKHLALSYYSKPPMIAYAQRLSTAIWGDNAFGVRFLSPTIGALLGLMLLRWMGRFVAGRTAFFLVLILQATPLLAAGTTLLTIDPLLVLFWTVAMILGWRPMQPDSTLWPWLGVGLAAGLAFLSKYSALYLVLCWAIFFALWPPARAQLRRAGPWLALLVLLLSTVPVLVWNAQHHWITMTHVSENAQLRTTWKPSLTFFLEFAGAEAGLLNPVFLGASLWAMAAFWKQVPQSDDGNARLTPKNRRGLMIYLFCMGGPVFLGHALYTLHSRVQANWIAPAVVPMFCLMLMYWEQRWLQGVWMVKHWLRTGLIIGFVVLVILHEPGLVGVLAGKPLPPDLDPLRRVRAWKETAAIVADTRERLMAEGKPVFVVAHHYGLTGLFSFYMPEAKPVAGEPPLVYSVLGPAPENQFFFWPEYRYQNFRAGQNAIFVVESDRPRYLFKAWLKSLLTGEPEPPPSKPGPDDVPPNLASEFESVKDLGVIPVYYRGRIYRWVQLFECRNLRQRAAVPTPAN